MCYFAGLLKDLNTTPSGEHFRRLCSLESPKVFAVFFFLVLHDGKKGGNKRKVFRQWI